MLGDLLFEVEGMLVLVDFLLLLCREVHLKMDCLQEANHFIR